MQVSQTEQTATLVEIVKVLKLVTVFPKLSKFVESRFRKIF